MTHSLLSQISLCLALITSAAAQDPTVTTTLPLRQVLVGETAALNIQSPEEASGSLQTVKESELTFRNLGVDYLNRSTVSFNIGVSADKTGTFEIPAFKVPLSSGTAISDPMELNVFPLDEIQWQTLQAESDSYRIGSVLLHPEGPIYAGQSIPITGKILVPVELPVSSTGFAELAKKNIGAWRMESPIPPNYDRQVSPRPPNAIKPREIRIEGQRYQVINYVTFAAPLAPGEVTLGPAEVKGLQILVSSERGGRGVFSRMRQSYNLDYEIPAKSLTALALPGGAPDDFDGAIGDFTLEAALDLTNELKSGEPIQVQLTVSGKGNLDILKAPQLDAPESNWKIYPASRNEQAGDRRTDVGTVVFSQILRPLVPIKELPPFSFSFFNPETATYQSLQSDAITLNLAPASASTSAPPAAGLVPIAEMTDILSIIPPQKFRAASGFKVGPLWHLIPAAITLFLVGLLTKRLLPKLVKSDPRSARIQQQISELGDTSDDTSFIRKAAGFAEQEELPQDSFVQELLAERDASCFQAGEARVALQAERRREILKNLKERATRVALIIAALLALLPHSGEASIADAAKAWEEADYEQALSNYQAAAAKETSPDLLYNIGNSFYRLEQPAQAALFYHRALRLDPNHPEAGQNLAFLNRKLGAISLPETESPAWTKKFPREAVVFALQLAVWLIVLSLLAKFALATSRSRGVASIVLIAASCLLVFSGLVLFFYPSQAEASFHPTDLVSASEAMEVRTEPSSSGSVILNANPATTCLVLRSRGDWSYIELPDSSRGWIQSDALSQI